MVVEEKMKCPHLVNGTPCGDENIIKHGFIERVRCPKCGSTEIVGHGEKVTVKKGKRKRCMCGNEHVIYRDELIKFMEQRYMCGKGHTFYKEDAEK